ncbi:MAG: translocation/assembly module TamB domain-containing protein [Gemmatimonadaceae bacterium]
MTRRGLVAVVSALVLFNIGVAAVFAVYLVTGTTRGREQLRSLIVPIIASRVHGGSIYIGHLSGSLITNITIDSLAIRDKRGELLVSTGRVTVAYNPRDLMDQRVFITRADIEHPYVHLIEHETGKWNFQEIFAQPPSTTPIVPQNIKSRSLGDYIVVDSAHTRNASFIMTLPWHPDDTLHGAARDSIIKLHLTQPERAVVKTFDGYGRVYAWTNAKAFLTHARLADPDSDKKYGQRFLVDSLAADEFEPTFKFRSVRGDIRKLGDSLWFEIPHFDMPASTGTGKGKVWWGSDLPVRYDIAIHGDSVTLDDVNWVYPTLPKTGGGTLDLLIKNSCTCTDRKQLDIIDFKLANMDVRSTKSHLTGTMTFATGAPLLLVQNVDVKADPVDFELLRTINGKPYPEDWQGRLTGTVKARGGPLTHFFVDDARGSFDDAHVSGAVSRFSAKGELDILFPAFTAFHSFNVDVAQLDMRTVEFLFPKFPKIHGLISGTATLDSSWLDVRFYNANVFHTDGPGDPSHFTGSGRITYGDLMVYDVALNAEPLSLTMVAKSFPNPLRGLFSGPFRAKGTTPDLETSFSLQGDAGKLTFDGHLNIDSVGFGAHGRGDFALLDPAMLLENPKIPAGTFSGHYDVDAAAVTMADLHGTANVDIEKTDFDSVKVYPSFAHLKFGDGRMSIVDSVFVQTAAGTFIANGALGLPKGQRDSLRFTFALDSLGGLRRYISNPDTTRLGAAATLPDSLSGALTVSGVAAGTLDSVNVTGRVNGSNLYFNHERGEELSARFNITAAGPSVFGAVDVSVDTVTLAGVALDTIGAIIQFGDQSHARFSAGAHSQNGPSAAVAGGWTKNASGSQTVVVDSLGLAIGDARWHLTAPATATVDSTGSRVDSLVLRNRDSASIAISANIPNAGAAAGLIRASKLPLKDLGVLAQLTDTLTGVADVNATISGTKAIPQLVADATLSSVKWRGVDIDRVTSGATYKDDRFNANLSVLRGGQTAVAAYASLPIELTLPLKTKWRNDTISGFVRADSADLSIVQTIIGPSVKSVSGRLSAHLDATGTERAPVLTGTASITNGSAQVVPAGVTFSEISAHFTGGRNADGKDSISVDSLVATTRDKNTPTGHARINGWIKDVLASSGDPSFSLALGADQFHAYDKRSIADVYFSTPTRSDSIQLKGSVTYSTLTGALRVDRGALFLADRDLARKQGVLFQSANDSSSGSGRAASATLSKLMTNLQIQSVPVTLGNDVRLRSKDANVRLVGELQLETQTKTSTRSLDNEVLVPRLGLTGTLLTQNGTYNLNLGVVQREFQVLQGGTVTFDGPPENPSLDITARYQVKQVRDLAIDVKLQGRLIPFPGIYFSSNADYAISTSDIISYLLTGSPGFDFGANAGTSQILASVLAPTVSALAANQLRGSLGPWVDVFQLQFAQGNTNGTASGSGFNLNGTTIGAEKQFGNNVYVSINTGFCQFTNNSPTFNPLTGVGAKVEYRFDPRLSFKVAYDPSTQSRCGSSQALFELAPTPHNFSLSFSHAWRF